MFLIANVSHKCECGEKINKEFRGVNQPNSLWVRSTENFIKCTCGRDYNISIDCNIGATRINIPNEKFIGKVYEHKGYKKVIKERDLKDLIDNPDLYKFVSDKAHADNDFSYVCGSDYCRCCQ